MITREFLNESKHKMKSEYRYGAPFAEDDEKSGLVERYLLFDDLFRAR